MSLAHKLKALSQRIPTTLGLLETEEATKNALIMPFLSALGYDVFDPAEVVPEFTADVGTKRGEKVDYAIKRGSEIIMLVEAKKATEDLDRVHASQLYRYFSVTSARIAILTNGVRYQFYSDLDEPNKMDERPFLELELTNLRDDLFPELEKLSKGSFDLESMLNAATDLKYMRDIRRFLELQFETPDEDLVRLCFGHANPTKKFTSSAKEQFTTLVRQTLHQVVTDRVGARLRMALQAEDTSVKTPSRAPEDATPVEETDERGIITTDDELEGFRIVKAIACAVLPPERVQWRDGKTYFTVLVDNSNRRPLCRLWFNRSQKYIGLFDHSKEETKHPIENLEDIYRFASQLRSTAESYAAVSDRDTGVTEPAQP